MAGQLFTHSISMHLALRKPQAILAFPTLVWTCRIDKAVARTIADIEHSSGPVDIVVNCTGGVCGQVGRPIEEVDESDWHSIFRANVDSAFWLAQAAGPGMTERGWGQDRDHRVWRPASGLA